MTLIWRDHSGKENTVFKRFTSADDARRAAKRLVIALNHRTNHPVRWNVRKRIPFNP